MRKMGGGDGEIGEKSDKHQPKYGIQMKKIGKEFR